MGGTGDSIIVHQGLIKPLALYMRPDEIAHVSGANLVRCPLDPQKDPFKADNDQSSRGFKMTWGRHTLYRPVIPECLLMLTRCRKKQGLQIETEDHRGGEAPC